MECFIWPMIKFLMHRCNSLIVLISILMLNLYGHSIKAQQHYSKRQLKKYFNEFVADSLLNHASSSIVIYDLRSNKPVLSSYGNLSLIPASIQKIIPAALLMEQAGTEFRYKTRFYLSGQRNEQGELDGHLIIEGNADPSFCSAYLANSGTIESIADSISKKLISAGIRKINGTIVLNNNYISDIPENPEWLWYDLGNYYGAGVYSLNYLENESTLFLKSSQQQNDTCYLIDTKPETEQGKYVSYVLGDLPSLDHEVFVLGSSKDRLKTIHGRWKCCIDDSLRLRAAMDNPPEAFRLLLMQRLHERGIEFRNSELTINDPSRELYVHYSDELINLVKRNLKRSVNLYSECFIHTLGDLKYGTTDRSFTLDQINFQLSQNITQDRALIMEDGSGLSPKNMMSSNNMIAILKWIYENKSLDQFWLYLPEVSTEGSLSRHINNNSNGIKLFLKSGSMERVKSYAGYLVKEGKPVFAISIIINHYTVSGSQINKLIADFFNKLQKTKI